MVSNKFVKLSNHPFLETEDLPFCLVQIHLTCTLKKINLFFKAALTIVNSSEKTGEFMPFIESWCQLSKTRPVYYIRLFCCVVLCVFCFLLFFFFHIWSDWQWSQVNKVLKSSVRLIFSFMTRKTDLCLSLVFFQELSLFPHSQHILFTGYRNSLVNDSRQCSAIEHKTGKQIYGNNAQTGLRLPQKPKQISQYM